MILSRIKTGIIEDKYKLYNKKQSNLNLNQLSLFDW